jgi:hypothetical protein
MKPLINSKFINLPIKNPTQTAYNRFRPGVGKLPPTPFSKMEHDIDKILGDRLKTEYSKFIE